jgi:hypothetical protein
MSKQSIKICISPNLNQIKEELVRPTLVTIFDIIGVKVEFSHDLDKCDFTYGINEDEKEFSNSVQVDNWLNIKNDKIVYFNNLHIPQNGVNDNNKIDYIYCCAFYLSGFHEKYFIQDFDVGTPGKDIEEINFHKFPIINFFCAELLEVVKKRLPDIRIAPVWPNNKKFAIIISHDCDRILKYRTKSFFQDFIFNLKAGKLKQSILYLIKFLLSFSNIKILDPYYNSFLNWIEFEKKLGSKGNYFIGVRSRFEFDADYRDLHYNENYGPIKSILNKLKVSENWDIGVHTSLNGWRYKGIFSEEKSRFEKSYQIKAKGFRGHHWSINNANTQLTFEMALECGYNYSSSLGMNDTLGFRRGICLPFIPVSEKLSKSFFYEFPPNAMDDSLTQFLNNKERSKALISFLELIKKYNGLLILDWHTDTLRYDFQDGFAFEVLKIIERLRYDSECWITTPTQILNWRVFDRWEQK